MLPSVSLYFVSFSRMSSPIELCARIRDPGEMGLELPPSLFFLSKHPNSNRHRVGQSTSILTLYRNARLKRRISLFVFVSHGWPRRLQSFYLLKAPLYYLDRVVVTLIPRYVKIVCFFSLFSLCVRLKHVALTNCFFNCIL